MFGLLGVHWATYPLFFSPFFESENQFKMNTTNPSLAPLLLPLARRRLLPCRRTHAASYHRLFLCIGRPGFASVSISYSFLFSQLAVSAQPRTISKWPLLRLLIPTTRMCLFHPVSFRSLLLPMLWPICTKKTGR